LATTMGNRSGKGMAMGMHFATLCAEDALLPVSLESAGRFSNSMESSYKAVCADWPKGQVDPAFYTTPKTTSPVMMLSGGIDPVTPPRHAERTGKLLGEHVQHIVVPKAGHGLLRLGCVRDLVFRFVDSKAPPAPDPKRAECLAAIPRAMAFVPMATQMRGTP
jgi:pimeloyl-ACP methyl ester carboxylesterase